MSNNGLPPLNDYQSDNYPVMYDEGSGELKYVKTGNKHTIDTGGSGYLVYAANDVTQSGSSDPSLTVLLPNGVGDIVWSRFSAGIYRGTLSGAFANGASIQVTNGTSSLGYNITAQVLDSNTVEIQTAQLDINFAGEEAVWSNVDNALVEASILITVGVGE